MYRNTLWRRIVFGRIRCRVRPVIATDNRALFGFCPAPSGRLGGKQANEKERRNYGIHRVVCKNAAAEAVCHRRSARLCQHAGFGSLSASGRRLRRPSFGRNRLCGAQSRHAVRHHQFFPRRSHRRRLLRSHLRLPWQEKRARSLQHFDLRLSDDRRRRRARRRHIVRRGAAADRIYGRRGGFRRYGDPVHARLCPLLAAGMCAEACG